MNCNDYKCASCDALPDISFSICAPSVSNGQITDLFISKQGHPFIDVEDADEWASRVVLSGNIPGALLNLKGIGSKAVPTQNTSTGAFGVSQYSNKTHQFAFKIHEVNESNYSLIRYFEKFPKATCWYGTGGGKCFGGNSGMDCEVVFNSIIPENILEVETVEGTITFTSALHPCRSNSMI